MIGDKLIEKWCPTMEEGGNKGAIVAVASARDSALTGGLQFIEGAQPGVSMFLGLVNEGMARSPTGPSW